MKTVIAPAGATNEFSTAVLVGDVEAQTRWSLGSLCAGILAQSTVPLLLFLQEGAQGAWNLKAYQTPVAGADLLASDFSMRIQRGVGTTKSRPVVIPVPAVDVTPADMTIDSSPANLSLPLHALAAELVLPPQTPSFTLLGVMNKFEPFLEGLTGWAVIVDQASEEIFFYEETTGSGTVQLIDAIMGSGVLVADYILTLDETAETVPGYGWE
jgi:hypothetical protein